MYKLNELIELTSPAGDVTTVKVIDIRAKAIKVRGNVSEAWFAKSAIDSDGWVADWVQFTISHCFLWDCPYNDNYVSK